MEAPEPLTIECSSDHEEKVEIKDQKTYQLLLNNEPYTLSLELCENNYIQFKLKKPNDPPYTQYKKSLNYNESLKVFLMSKDYYTNIDKIYNAINKLANKNKAIIVNKNNKIGIVFKRIIEEEEVECYIEFELKKLSQKEIIDNLLIEINDIKQKQITYINEQQKIIELINKKGNNKEQINPYKDIEANIKEEQNKIKESISKIKIDNDKIINIGNIITTIQNDNNNNKIILNQHKQQIKSLIDAQNNNNNILTQYKQQIQTLSEENKFLKDTIIYSIII